LNTTTSAKKTTVSKNYSGLESKNRQNLWTFHSTAI
jgi:hypothetical protein